MNLTDLQHQVTQSAEAASTVFIYLPILVLMIPLLLVYFPLRSLRTLFNGFNHFCHGLMHSAHKRSS
jgi:hypothetical protein